MSIKIFFPILVCIPTKMSSRCCYLVASNFAGRLFLEIPEFPKFSARVARTWKNLLTGWWRLLEVEISKEPRKKGIAQARQSSNKPRFYFAPSIRSERSPFSRYPLFPKSLSTRNKHFKRFFWFFLNNLRDLNTKILKYEETSIEPFYFTITGRRRLYKRLEYTLR